MLRPSKDEILKDIDEALKLTTKPSDETLERLWEVGTRLDACLRRHILPGDPYDRQARVARQKMENAGHEPDAIDGYRGILRALRGDVESGRAETVFGRVSGQVLSDLLDQAQALVDERWILPAAVLAGAALEEHIRNHCVKASVPITDQNGRPVNANTLNAGLRGVGLYDETHRAQIEAWQKVRNDAAHNKIEFQNQTPGTINLMVAGIRGFLVRFPL